MSHSATHKVDETQLMDIELPLAPGIDWLGMGQNVLLILIVVVILTGIYWAMTHYWLRIRLQLQLRHQLRRFTKSATLVERQKVQNKVYQTFLLAQRHQLIPMVTAAELSQLINQACFSKTGVSRETFSALLQQFDQVLSKHRPKLTWVLATAFQKLLCRLSFRKGCNDD